MTTEEKITTEEYLRSMDTTSQNKRERGLLTCLGQPMTAVQAADIALKNFDDAIRRASRRHTVIKLDYLRETDARRSGLLSQILMMLRGRS